MSQKNSPYVRFALRLFIVFVLATLIAACDNTDKDSSPSKPEMVAVKIYLEAPQIEYAGIFAAISQGYFEDEQLDVELIFSITGGSSTTDAAAVEGVLSGLPIFVGMNAETVLAHRQQGEDMVAVMSLYQRDSRSIVSNVNRGITVPADLVGKRVLVFPGDEMITQAFLDAAGVNPQDVTFVQPTPDQGINAILTAIMGGQFDGIVYSIEADVQLTATAFPTSRLAFIDYGIQSYPNVLVTSQQLIDANPKVVQRFVNAVLRGLQYSLEQPREVATWFAQTYSNQLHVVQLRIQDQAIRSIVPLMRTTTSNPGMMTSETWNHITQDLKDANLLDAAVVPNEAYSLKFVNEYYQ